MNKKEIEEYKKLSEQLICVPSGFKRKDGTEIMSWSLREWFEDEKIENNNNIVKEDSAEYQISSSITNSKHDKLFKKLLSNEEEASGIINLALGWKNEITPNMLEMYNKEYITDKFEKEETDIAYKIAEKNLYIIIEHQSTVDRSMPFRILNYKIAILNQVVDKTKMKKVDYEFPRVIAIVLYTGRRKWKYKKLEDLQRPLKYYKEDEDFFILIDVNNYTRENLMSDDLITTKAMLIEKDIDKEDFFSDLTQIANKVAISTNPRVHKMYHILSTFLSLQTNDKELLDKMNSITKKAEGDEVGMSERTKIIDRVINHEKAKERSLVRKESKMEIAKKMKDDKLSYEIISKYTGLKLKEIEAL